MTNERAENPAQKSHAREALERLGLSDLVAEAGSRFEIYCGNRVWLVSPLATQGSSDRHDYDASCDALAEVEEVIGRRLVDGVSGAGEPLYHAVGENVVRGFFAEEFRRHEQEIDWWRSAAWHKLRDAGVISESEFQALTEECPNHNPLVTPTEEGA